MTQYYDNVRVDLAAIGPPVAALPVIPTLSTWALIATALLLVALAWRRFVPRR